MYNFNLMVNTGNMVLTQYLNTDVNLLEMYKSALASKSDKIVWEKGVISLKTIIGIIDNSPTYPKDALTK